MNLKKIILSVIKENPARVISLSCIVISVALVSLIPPQLLKILVDRLLSEPSAERLAPLCAVYALTILLIGALDFGKGWLLTSLGMKIIRATRKQMMVKIERVSIRYFSENPSGAILSRFMTDTESINTLFTDGIISMLVDCLKIIGILISIAFFSRGLAVLTAILIPILFFITRAFQQRMLQAQQANLEELGKVSNHISESIKNIRIVKLMGKESWMEDVFCQRLTQNYATKQQVNVYDSFYAPVIQLLRAVAIAIVVTLSSDGVQLLGLTAGMLAASIELLCNLLAPVESLGMEFQNIQQGISGVRRVDEFLALPEDEKDDSLSAASIIGQEGARIVFDQVRFAYEDGEEILRDVSFSIEPHSSATLAGRTGVGKTTLMNLALGLLIPQHGTIAINGFPTCLIPDKEKRFIFGYVEQQFQFVPGTVAKQISLGDERITQKQVEDACRFVGLEDTIMQLPLGYETVVQNGEEFSFGQRQLLSIARAIVANPPILLLDESSANLDSATEELVLGVLHRACADRTIMNISHRAASMLRCDQLILLEHGQASIMENHS